MLPRITHIAPTRIPTAFDDPDFVWELNLHDRLAVGAACAAAEGKQSNLENSVPPIGIVSNRMRLLAPVIAKIPLQVGSLSIAAVAITEGISHRDMHMVGGGTSLIVSLLVDARKNQIWFRL